MSLVPTNLIVGHSGSGLPIWAMSQMLAAESPLRASIIGTLPAQISRTCSSLIHFTLPFYASLRGATLALAGSAILTTVWYMLDNPYGIDNIYISLVVPLVVIIMERLVRGGRPAVPETGAESGNEGPR